MRDELKEILGLKNVLRAGWVRAGIESPESVAAHSWGMSMLALKLSPKELDLARVLSLCIVHDIPEVRVGDLTPHDDTSTKAEDELNAMKEMAPEWVGLFEEYEQGKTPEAKFVKQLDKLDMALQAEIYQSKFDIPLTEFIESARLRIDDEVLKNILS
jgi:putative hydrolase of HD superfamily